ncbi:diguanylate cyclase [Malonomonas rubra]|nr:diguanylate cyclase [Malonomonas rubra]
MSDCKTFDLYLAGGVKADEPGSSIEYLSASYGEDIFQRLLNNLLNKEFSVQEATAIWRAAMKQFSKENVRLNWRSVILDYLLGRTDLLDNPLIIEASELRNLQQQAITDGLTNLYNQAYFKAKLTKTVEEHRKSSSAFSLLLLDLDHFKQFNDRCGHLRGDQTLAQVAQTLCATLPENSVVSRYGGEEFAVILPQTDLLQAIQLAEQVRAAVEKNSFAGEERLDKGTLTISGGIVSYPAAGMTGNELIAQADSKLYQAKLNRNKIVPGKNETRHITRHSINNIVEIFDNKSGNFKNALSADISHTGILLKSSTPAVIGSNLKLRFPYPFWPSDHYTNGQVRHVRRSGKRGGFLLGIEFAQPQPDFVGEILPLDRPQQSTNA